jgi:hypothetical protein
MNDSITLIVTIRDREAWRIEKLVGSLRLHGGEARAIVVDYGSEKPYAEQYAAVCRSIGIEYERMETEGRPWNKCLAINRGVRLARGEYVCTADVDIFFTSDPLTYCVEHYDEKKMFHIDTYWLGKGGDIGAATPAGRGNPGGFQFIGKNAFEESGGYDERIVFWGLEDLDWPRRLGQLGYEQVWLPERYRIYHQWHSSSGGGARRPAIASFDTMSYCIENRINPVLSQDWGKAAGLSDRPILSMIESRTPDIVRISKNALMHYGNIDILLDTRGWGRFVKLELGARLVKRPLSRFAGVAKSIMRPITAVAGLDCDEKTNRNFDYFYAMLPVLLENGLEDYFIVKDLSEVFLYWAR